MSLVVIVALRIVVSAGYRTLVRMLIKTDGVLATEPGTKELTGCQSRGKDETGHEAGDISPSPGKAPRESAKFTTGKYSDRLGQSSSLLDVTEITPNLLLCGAIAIRGTVLEDLKVTCVINATTELPDTPLPDSIQNDVLYLRVGVDDKTDSDILQWLDVVTDMIYQVKQAGGKTLVHCVAGISRSATLCLAYLIKYEGYTLYDSYLMLKALRHMIRPNSGFFGQLVEFEKQTTGKQTVFMVRSDFTNSWIPELYEEDFRKFYSAKHRRRQP